MSALAAFAWLLPATIGLLAARRLSGGWSPALGAARAGALALAGIWVLVRLFDFLARGGGPLAWTGVARGAASDAAPLVAGVLRLSLVAGLLLGATAAIAARLQTRPVPLAPLGAVAASVAALAAVLVAGTFAAGPLVFATALPLDLAACVPAIAAGVAAGFLAPTTISTARAPATGQAVRDGAQAGSTPAAATATTPAAATATTPAAATTPAPAPPPPDPEPRLRAARLLPAAPAFTCDPGTPAAPAGASELDRAWRAAGGRGPAPRALLQLLERIDAPGPGLLVADLPAPTGTALAVSLILSATAGRGARLLVLCPDPATLVASLRSAEEALAVQRSGIATAREGELRDAVSRGLLPSVIALALRDLGGPVLGLRTPGGESWVATVDLVLVLDADRLGPVEATHLAFGLRRLGLVLDAHRRKVAWAAIGPGDAGTLRFLEQAALRPFERLALGTDSRLGVRIYVRVGGAPAGEIDAALRVLGEAAATVEDSIGELADLARGRVPRRPGYHGRVAVARVEDRDLASLYRARASLAHQVPGDAHLGLWWVDDTPLARFLLGEGVLQALDKQDELPAPQPVAGLGNRFLVAAHLEAALREGTPDEAALRRAFGDEAVDGLRTAREDVRIEGRRARWDPAARAIDASPILRLPAASFADPRRETVTASAVEIRASVDGSVLRRVDRRVASTRYYPHRVFRVGAALHVMPPEPLSLDAARLTAAPAPAGAAPTDPELTLELSDPTWIARPEQHASGKVVFARGLTAIDVRERVTGAIPRGGAGAATRFAAVASEYPSRAAILLFAALPSAPALRHAGRLAAELLPAHLAVERDDVEVLVLAEGVAGVRRPALAFVDRHVGGVGVAEALDARTLHTLLRWTWGVLYRCPCLKGCPACTPADVLAAGPDKVGALKLLGG